MLHLVRCQISNVKNPIDMSCSFTEVCSESWVDCGYLVHYLEVSDMNVLRRIARVNRRDQWDNHIRNCDIRKNLRVTSVEEAARVSRLRWFGHLNSSAEVAGVRGSDTPRRRFLDSVRSDLEVRGLTLDERVISLAQDMVAWRG